MGWKIEDNDRGMPLAERVKLPGEGFRRRVLGALVLGITFEAK